MLQIRSWAVLHARQALSLSYTPTPDAELLNSSPGDHTGWLTSGGDGRGPNMVSQHLTYDAEQRLGSPHDCSRGQPQAQLDRSAEHGCALGLVSRSLEHTPWGHRKTVHCCFHKPPSSLPHQLLPPPHPHISAFHRQAGCGEFWCGAAV